MMEQDQLVKLPIAHEPGWFPVKLVTQLQPDDLELQRSEPLHNPDPRRGSGKHNEVSPFLRLQRRDPSGSESTTGSRGDVSGHW